MYRLPPELFATVLLDIVETIKLLSTLTYTPPPSVAEFPYSVLLLIWTGVPTYNPPPKPMAELLSKVLFVKSSPPALKIAPPLLPARFPENVLVVRARVRPFAIAPPFCVAVLL